MENRLGLIAGNGKFPILFAIEARRKGTEIVAIGIKEETSKELEKYVAKIHWLGVGELSRLLKIFSEECISSAVMAGQVQHKHLFDGAIKIDPRMWDLLNKLKDKKTDSLIGAIAGVLESSGIKLLESTTFLWDYLPEKGILTDKELSGENIADIEFGRDIAKSIAGLDIGQTVVVKNKTVLAVESIEGTDEAIKRGAKYGKEGIVVVKVSKPAQDMRFDIPVIGPETMSLLKELQASCLAIEAKKTLIIDKNETIKAANDSGIGIIAL